MPRLRPESLYLSPMVITYNDDYMMIDLPFFTNIQVFITVFHINIYHTLEIILAAYKENPQIYL
jgi:hypothetical protein